MSTLTTMATLFTLPATTGKTGKQRAEEVSHNLIKSVLLSNNFFTTVGNLYTVAIIPGTFFTDNTRTLANISELIISNGWLDTHKMNLDALCTLNDALTQTTKDSLGFGWLISMHPPIKDSSGDYCRLAISRGSATIGAITSTPKELLPSHYSFLCVTKYFEPLLPA